VRADTCTSTAARYGAVVADWFKGRQLTELRCKRQSIIDETTDELDTVSLINADIGEFEQRLGEARRDPIAWSESGVTGLGN
jgi:hypothetical protein